MCPVNLTVDATSAMAMLDSLEGIATDTEFNQLMLDCAEVMESHCKEQLMEMVYDKPERGYSRNMSAGLLGATKASTKVTVKKGVVAVGVESKKEYAVYVHSGTGIHAADGKGRKTPWKYKDGAGRWHTTVGVIPKPYLTKGAVESIPEVEKILGKPFNKGG